MLSGPTSALAFSESVLCVMDQSAKQLGNKEHLWRMWSIVVNPLTEWINQVINSLIHQWLLVLFPTPRTPQENFVLSISLHGFLGIPCLEVMVKLEILA